MDAIEQKTSEKKEKGYAPTVIRYTVYVNINTHTYIYIYIYLYIFMCVCMFLRSSYAYLYNSRPLKIGPALIWFTSKEIVTGTMHEILRVRRLKRRVHRAARRCLTNVRRHHSPRAWPPRVARLVRELLAHLQSWGLQLGPGMTTSHISYTIIRYRQLSIFHLTTFQTIILNYKQWRATSRLRIRNSYLAFYFVLMLWWNDMTCCENEW